MNPTTRKAALRAVAQLTWAGGWTAVLACGGHSTSDSPSNAGASASAGTATGGAPIASGDTATTTGGALSASGSNPTAAGGALTASGDTATTTGGALSASGSNPTAAGGALTASGAGGQGETDATEPVDQLACTAAIPFDPQHVAPTPVSNADLACCVDEVLAKMSDVTAKTDPSVINCCTAIVLGSTATSPQYASPVRSYCCFGGVVTKADALYGLSYCTPWGPPVPPHLAELEA